MTVQLRLKSTQTVEEYITQQGWEQATLDACPLCEPGTCHFHRLGTYMRKVPAVGYVARRYCPEKHTTFGLLPDFYASRTPGTLDAIEQAALGAEASSIEQAASAERPADTFDAVSLPAAVTWLRRRIAWVRALLAMAAGLLPERFAGLGLSVASWRKGLDTSRVLVELRGICEQHLYALPRPLGLNPRGALKSGRSPPTNNARG